MSVLAIIDYGSGNLRSVAKAFERAAADSGISRKIEVTDNPQRIAGADRIVLPGVGAFAACMKGLAERKGVLEALEHRVLREGRPFLGICVGMQLLADQGLEFGSRRGLGWIAGEVGPIAENGGQRRSPHMGWNSVTLRSGHSLLDGLDGEAFYFAHSYHFEAQNNKHLIGVTDYHGRLAAAVARDNIVGVQFHPEKSQRAGVALLSNFLTWDPS